MRPLAINCSGLAILLMGLTACAQNPLARNNQPADVQQQQTAFAQQNRDLQSRLASLDQDNQELETLLARARQQSQILDDQMAAIRDQLSDTNTQLAVSREAQERADEETKTMAASVRRRRSASISANNSLRGELPAISIEGVDVRRDGDVVRIELAGDKLFESGSARLQSGASRLIRDVADRLAEHYPDQVIGVEGHTDSDAIAASGWNSNHQLSVGRAMAVYDQLISQSKLRADRLFIAGHGANHPVVSNATTAGKQRNRRVELVVYPEHSG